MACENEPNTLKPTLVMAPRLADGVLIGVVVTILLFLASTMKPRKSWLRSFGSLPSAAS